MTQETLHESPPLFPPEVTEVTLRVGVVQTANHLQWSLEVRDATDGALLAMVSTPHRPLAHTPDVVTDIADALGRVMYALVEPF